MTHGGSSRRRRAANDALTAPGAVKASLSAAAVTAAVATAVVAFSSNPDADPRRADSPRSSTPSSAAKPARESFTVLATGDVLIHPRLTEQAEADGGGKRDFGPLFAGVKPLVSGADLALCHLEVPLADADGPFAGYPSFYAPPEVADALAETGYDACSTASNHTLDQGVEGVTSTLDALDDAGLEHTGSYRTAEDAQTPLLLDVNGVKVGHLSFTYGYNGLELPSDKPWLANTLDADAVSAAAVAAREAGADVVVASVHWGIEHQHEPTDEQQQLAKELLADVNVDLLIGHHAHVVQPFEKIGHKWVAYGLGNHVARHDEPTGHTEDGIAARFTFTRGSSGWRVSRAEYLPTFVDLGPPIRLVDLSADGMAAEYPESLQRIDQVVLSRGGAGDGLSRP